MHTQTKDTQAALSPAGAVQMLKDGNKRFIEKSVAERDLHAQIETTSGGQFPFAAVLSCIDSRVPAEIVFDQGIGDIFSARVAGNVVNGDILGSIEYACKVAGSKAIVVLGHTSCGAVTAACKNVELGNITGLLEKIKPAISSLGLEGQDMDAPTIEKVAEENVRKSIEQIKADSPILNEMASNGEIEIVGAIYNVGNGQVTFL